MLASRFVLPFLGFVFGTGGCVGEASATYKGSVVEGDTPGSSFDTTRNPAALPPVEGVRVSLCESERCKAISDSSGTWGPVETVFGGSAFSDAELSVRFEADGFEPFVYSTVYETTADPTNGEKFLNVKMRRRR
jgi:hypothetical protein